jgi:excisionase family DNA binding protein
VTEAAELLNVSRWTIYRWIEEGRLEATKIGRSSLRVFRRSVLDLVESRRIAAWGPRPVGRAGPAGPDSSGIPLGRP